jgi:hypothetical protein
MDVKTFTKPRKLFSITKQVWENEFCSTNIYTKFTRLFLWLRLLFRNVFWHFLFSLPYSWFRKRRKILYNFMLTALLIDPAAHIAKHYYSHFPSSSYFRLMEYFVLQFSRNLSADVDSSPLLHFSPLHSTWIPRVISAHSVVQTTGATCLKAVLFTRWQIRTIRRMGTSDLN